MTNHQRKHVAAVITGVVLCALCHDVYGRTVFIVDGIVYEELNQQQKTARVIPLMDYPQEVRPEDTYHSMNITALTVPEMVTNPISGQTYSVVSANLCDNPYLEEINLPEGLLAISEISNFPRLTRFVIPESVISIGAITGIRVNELNLPESLEEFTPPPVMGLINMSDLPEVRTLKIPAGITELHMAVANCENLVTLDISNVTTLTHCVHDCPALKTIYFSPKLKYTELSFINLPALDEIWFPSDGNQYPWSLDMLSFRGCTPKAVYCARPNPPSFFYSLPKDEYATNPANLMFGGAEKMKDIILYVRPECVDIYRSTPNWGLMDIRPYDFTNSVPLTETDQHAGEEVLFDLAGRHVTDTHPAPGIYISNGRKTAIRAR